MDIFSTCLALYSNSDLLFIIYFFYFLVSTVVNLNKCIFKKIKKVVICLLGVCLVCTMHKGSEFNNTNLGQNKNIFLDMPEDGVK